MIIQRLSKGIKDQDWFVVMVEVMIVVVGIFLGLQVDDWNEARKGRIEEKSYIERLKNETAKNILNYEYMIQMMSKIDETLVNYHAYLIGEGTVRPDNTALLRQVCRSGIAPRLIQTSSVYDELLSTGKLSLISDQHIRESLTDLYREMNSSYIILGDRSTVDQRLYVELEPYRKMLPNIDDNTQGLCDFNFQSFEKDGFASSHIASLQRSAHFMSLLWQDSLVFLNETATLMDKRYPSNGDESTS